MLKLFRRRMKPPPTVEFCEPCAQACTSQCRADALLDKARTHAMQLPYLR